MSACDMTPATISCKRHHVAIKQHVCTECGNTICIGERYVNVFGVWEGEPTTFKQCKECADLEQHMIKHCPSWCEVYGSLRDEAHEAISCMDCNGDGVKFGAWRRYAKTGKRGGR